MDIELHQLHSCLDALEEQEICLLAWGDCDGFFSEEEVLATLKLVLPEHDPEIVKIELLEHAMLFDVPHQTGAKAYRTRMAASVHLYRNLRQWFHRQQLEQSRVLVSDYRFIRRPRSFPKREFESKLLLQQWQEKVGLSELEHEIMQQLLHPIKTFCLSGFQVRGTERIFKAWQYHSSASQKLRHSTGTIICAGTGSGKTLSFYLPAITRLAADICADSDHRVRILAIYPRKELLKDQFMELWSQCRKLDRLMRVRSVRKLRIGAYFGDTPYNLNNALSMAGSSQGMHFDLLRCGETGCSGKMMWLKSSMCSNEEELTCTVCKHKVRGDEVGLTRDALVTQPPDILFTTTEMLNQNLSNNYQNILFGVGYHVKAPPIVLLDEVHTYGGSTGAQTGLLLRRWMLRVRCRPHYVGLSATLADAEAYFSHLIGAYQSNVELIEPKQDEIESQGAEYLLALRGDPVSQTALISTTIQATMLTRRVLDPLQGGKSEGTWGAKTFIFTDDLDATNRLYHQLSDAEGWRTSYRGLQPNGSPLAHLREPDMDQRKIVLGQNWRVCQDIGHSLSNDDRAFIARTSSQDEGVDARADSIVATSSLEVGFNDHLVGAVIQHKAPRDVSSYLQRKGRAGRSTIMRPWMIVILSEFGRDRVTFQRYEDLVNPEIKRQGLPLRNGHIQKMQAAMATLDWLSTQTGRVAIWNCLKSPGRYTSQCNKLHELVSELLTPSDLQQKYTAYLGWALDVNEPTLQQIMWAPPRSIMLEFLPTLHRLLTTQWREQGKPWKALTANRSPLPHFIPDALFSSLNIRELNIGLRRGREGRIEWEALSFYQALREFAPGRISKRYAVTSGYEADWLVPADFQPDPIADLMQVPFEVTEAFGENVMLECEVERKGGESLKIVRPTSLQTLNLSKNYNLTEKSNANLQWDVAFKGTNQEGAIRHAPPKGNWKDRLIDTTFFIHNQLNPLEVTRYSFGSLASLRFKGGAKTNVRFDWQLDGEKVGVGDRQWVDGMRFRFKVPDETIAELKHNQHILRAIRPVFFRHCVAQLDCFENDPFTANWVAECVLAALAKEVCGITSQEKDPIKNIRKGLSAIQTKDGKDKLLAIPFSLFQPDEQQATNEQSLHERLRQIFANQEVMQQIECCEAILWEDPSSLTGLDEWLRQILANTLAGAAQQMLCVLLTDVEERAVLADAMWQDDVLEIWLTEAEGGGSGVISRMSQAYFEDPVCLLNILVRCLQPSDYEQIDFDLFYMLEMLEQDKKLRTVVDEVRFAADHKTRRQATTRLQEKLQEVGFSLTHSFNSVLFSRIIRPGSTQESDALLLDLLRKWNKLERISGLEWGLNIAAHSLAHRSFKEDVQPAQVFDQFCRYQGLLWPRGYEIRQSELGFYSPFQNGPTLTERLLGATLFDDHTPQVAYQAETWIDDLHDTIRRVGRVDLVVEHTKIDEISKVITRIQAEPLEYCGMFLYPRMRKVRRFRRQVLLQIEMAELLQ